MATGPHTGEAWLYAWLDATLAASVNERGEIADVEDLLDGEVHGGEELEP